MLNWQKKDTGTIYFSILRMPSKYFRTLKTDLSDIYTVPIDKAVCKYDVSFDYQFCFKQ